jgi:hypothetical protein
MDQNEVERKESKSNNDVSCVCNMVQPVVTLAGTAVLAMTSNVVTAWGVPLHTPAAAPPTPTAKVGWALACHSVAHSKAIISKVIKIGCGMIMIMVESFGRVILVMMRRVGRDVIKICNVIENVVVGDMIKICDVVKDVVVGNMVQSVVTLTRTAMLAMTSHIVATRGVPLHTPAAAPTTPTTEIGGTLASHSVTHSKAVIAKVIKVRRGCIHGALDGVILVVRNTIKICNVIKYVMVRDMIKICDVVKHVVVGDMVQSVVTLTGTAMLAVTSNIVTAWGVPLHTPTAAPSTPTTKIGWALASHSIALGEAIIPKVIQIRHTCN